MGLPEGVSLPSCLWPPDCGTVEATVPTGFEALAADECREKLEIRDVNVSRGHLFFPVLLSRLQEVLHLRSVDNLYVVVAHWPCLPLIQTDKETALSALSSAVLAIPWDQGLALWKCVCSTSTNTGADFSPTFRVTCNRVGSGHSFTSMDAASRCGGAINDLFRWPVDMTQFDLEIVLNIRDNSAYISFAITKESLHRRNIVSFGPTTLRATIAYNLLRFSSIRPGDVVCDPMCGSGAIPIEAACNWPSAIHLCGDIHPIAVNRTLENLRAKFIDRFYPAVSIFQWDMRYFPVRSDCVDLCVTDLPFGKRSGSRFDNRVLYPQILSEMARICKQNTGRAVLLTHDTKTLIKSLRLVSSLWTSTRTLNINIGGLTAGVYLLHRNTNVWFDFKSKRKH